MLHTLPASPRRWFPTALLVGLAGLGLLATGGPAGAQGLFGKNKVQYGRLDWQALRTDHIEVFFYPEEEGLAREVAAIAESTAAEFDTTFRLQLKKRIPVLFYSSHQQFQQTNATPGFISEGTGGLTELIKGRVILPHTGSYHRLRWVTRHELTHAYMLEKLAQVQRTHKRYRGSVPPLWFIEGLAEFLGTEWDSQAEGLLQDAMVSGVALPVSKSYPIEGTVLMYKEGQSFLLYLEERYGARKVMDLLDNWWRAETFEKVFHVTFGAPLDSVDQEWFTAMRRRYYPQVAVRRPLRDIARPITGSEGFHLAPAIVPSALGSRDSTLQLVYLEAKDGAVDLKLLRKSRGQHEEERLLRGGFSSQFESFHLFRSRLGVSRDRRVAIVSQRGGRDVLHIYDIGRREVLYTWQPPGLVGLASPTWLPGDTAVVVVGQSFSGQTDLFRIRVADGAVTRLTDDPSDEADPSSHPTRNAVVFSSDRVGGTAGYYHLFELDLATDEIRQLTSGLSSEREPTWAPDGRRLAFRSDREGIDDLYLWEEGRVQRATRFLGPVLNPCWRPDGKALVFAGQSAFEFRLYEVGLAPVDSLWTAETVDRDRLPWATPPRAVEPAEPYRRRLGLDIAQNAVALDPSLGGAGGGGQIVFSDLLGNEQLYIFLSNDASSLGSFLDGFEVGLTYFNRGQRLNYGVGAFRLAHTYDVDLDVLRRERRVGGVLLASYPLDKFTRIEGSTVVRYAQDHFLRNGDFRNLWLFSNFLAFVRDDARFTYRGPAGGTRLNITGGFTRDLSSGEGDFFTLTTDMRKYAEVLPDVVYAARLVGQSSFGDDAQRFYMGGRYNLRGYPRRILDGQKVALLQQEVRFPILQRLRIGFPLPIEFPTVNAVLMADAAVAGDTGQEFEKRGSAGVGFYVGGGYFPVLRWNFLKRTDFVKFDKRTVTQFVLGFNF